MYNKLLGKNQVRLLAKKTIEIMLVVKQEKLVLSKYQSSFVNGLSFFDNNLLEI
jgi:hypothetical protein